VVVAMTLVTNGERKCAENYQKIATNLSAFQTAIGILVISNHNCFRVLFDKIAVAYFTRETYISILALEMAGPGNQQFASCIGTLLVPMNASCNRVGVLLISSVRAL